MKSAVSRPVSKIITDVPLPNSVSTWDNSTKELLKVNGIDCEYYAKLNDTLVEKLPRDMSAKQRVIDPATRGYKKDSDGNYIYNEYKVPTGSVVVISSLQLNIPWKEYVKPTKGYGYIDFIETSEGRKYLYVVPKTKLYKVNMTALVISYAPHMRCYEGRGYQTWRNGVIFLRIVPYKATSKFSQTKILKTWYGTNYAKECAELMKYWSSINFVVNSGVCELSNGTNLALTECETIEECYIPFELIPISDKEIYGLEGGVSGGV